MLLKQIYTVILNKTSSKLAQSEHFRPTTYELHLKAGNALWWGKPAYLVWPQKVLRVLTDASHYIPFKKVELHAVATITLNSILRKVNVLRHQVV